MNIGTVQSKNGKWYCVFDEHEDEWIDYSGPFDTEELATLAYHTYCLEMLGAYDEKLSEDPICH